MLNRICAVVCALMLCGFPVAFGAADALIAPAPAAADTSAGSAAHVIVEGTLSSALAGKQVYVMLIDKAADPNDLASSMVRHTGTAVIQKDGSYSYTFDYAGDTDACRLMVVRGNQSINKSVTKAVQSSDPSGKVLQLGKEYACADAAAKKAAADDIAVLIGSTDTSRRVILAMYDTEGKLINVQVSQGGDDTDSAQVLASLEGAKTAQTILANPAPKKIVLGDTAAKPQKARKVLAIGNSFTDNSFTYLSALAEADGSGFVFARATIGSSPLQLHWENAQNDAKNYAYVKTGQARRQLSLKEALQDDDWDYVVMQQLSNLSPDYATYQPYLANLAAFAAQYAPNAKLLIHQTWAYKYNCPRLTGELGYSDQKDMFTDLEGAYNQAAESLNTKIIPSGQAFQNALAGKPQMDLFAADGFHASVMGCYLAGAVWYEALTGNQVALNPYAPAGIGKDDLDLLKDSAHAAVKAYGWQ